MTTPAGGFRVIVSATGPITLSVGTGQVAEGFARTVQAPVLVCRVHATLPVQISTSWQQASGPGPGPAGRRAGGHDRRHPIGGTR